MPQEENKLLSWVVNIHFFWLFIHLLNINQLSSFLGWRGLRQGLALCTLGPQTRDPPASASKVLGLQVCTTIPIDGLVF